MNLHDYDFQGDVRIRCKCGAVSRVHFPFYVPVSDMPDELDERAAEQGWGDRSTCADCQKKIDKDVAEVQAADAFNETQRLKL